MRWKGEWQFLISGMSVQLFESLGLEVVLCSVTSIFPVLIAASGLKHWFSGTMMSNDITAQICFWVYSCSSEFLATISMS